MAACAQVRFSKLPFRHVVRSYGTDLVYTPMIMADSFTASQKVGPDPCVVRAPVRVSPSALLAARAGGHQSYAADDSERQRAPRARA